MWLITHRVLLESLHKAVLPWMIKLWLESKDHIRFHTVIIWAFLPVTLTRLYGSADARSVEADDWSVCLSVGAVVHNETALQ